MKTLSRYITIAVVAGVLALSQSAWAGDCCKKAANATKKGKACEKCLTEACCKEASKKVVKDGEAKECTKCAAKKS